MELSVSWVDVFNKSVYHEQRWIRISLVRQD